MDLENNKPLVALEPTRQSHGQATSEGAPAIQETSSPNRPGMTDKAAVDGAAAEPRRRKRGARFKEIAAEAGVSEATVDRVLNERGSVSAAALERVVAAALKLGVPRVLPDVRHGILHMDVILPRNSSPMFQRLDLALKRATQMLDRRVVVHRITLDRHNDTAFARAICSPPYRRSGLIVVGSAATKTLAALNQAISSGEPVITLVTDLPGVNVTHYAGIDNLVAGRTAGHMIARLTRGEGRVLILRGLERYAAHDQRVDGCVQALQAAYPQQAIEVIATETNDDPDICYRLTCDALRAGPLGAIYNTGDGSAGIYQALKRFKCTGSVVWVGHEMQDAHAQYLSEGCMDLVIDQNPDGQAIGALQYLLYAWGQLAAPPSAFLGEFNLFMLPNARQAPYLAKAPAGE